MRKRFPRFLMALCMVLTLLPTTAMAAKKGGIQEIVLSMTEPQVGKTLPTDVKVVSPADVVLDRYTWSSDSTSKVMEQGVGYSITLSLSIKPGSDAYFHLSSVTAKIGGKTAKCMVSKQEKVTVSFWYSAEKPNPAANYKPETASAQSYDTFDYRAYANIYPDLKAAYGYNAEKLYAHYVNFGKAEGRVGTFISGSNPKSGAPIFGLVPGTNKVKTEGEQNTYAVVPATLLDAKPPESVSQLNNWRLNQLTHVWWMSNAKLVAEFYYTSAYMGDHWGGSLSTEPVEVRTKFTIPEELDARITAARDVYDYEHGIQRSGLTESAYRDSKASDVYRRASCSDTTILLQCYAYRNGKSTFAPPPADPGKPGQPPAKTAGGFTDVFENSYFAQPVVWAVGQKITSGKTANTFAPGETCSQAQILTFLWRSQGSPEPAGTVEMEGFTGSEYYYKAARWAAEQDMIEGDFDPDAPCTRAMAMTFMWKQAGSPQANAASFTDVSAGAAYAPAVAWAVEKGITGGTTPTTFAPEQTCTRGQIVTFLYRAFAE